MSQCPACGQHVYTDRAPTRATYAACSDCDAVECSTEHPCCVSCSESAGLNHLGDAPHPDTMAGK